VRDRLPARVRNRREREEEPWQHALQRARERHWPDFTYPELRRLASSALAVYSWHASGLRGDLAAGAVLATESDGSAVVRVCCRGKNVLVVLDPVTEVLRTVLPTKIGEKGVLVA
jgi:hypothetical protein